MIDMNPAVGRIVVRRDDHPNGLMDVLHVGRVTRVVGQRIEYDRRHTGAGHTQPTEPRQLLMKTVLCFCDTDVELMKLVHLHTEQFTGLVATRQMYMDKFQSLWSK